MTAQPYERSEAAVGVSVVIVNWNGGDLLTECLARTIDALRRSSLKVETIVVDNHSTDGSSAALHDRQLGVRLVSLPERTSFAAANNAGVRAASPASEFLLFLNSDAWLTEGCLDRLVDYLRVHPRCAAVGPAEYAPDGTIRRTWWPLPTPPERYFAGLMLAGAGCRGPSTTVPRAYSVRYLGGFCILSRKAPFHAVGWWDEQFEFYSEDVDLGLRLHRAGFSLAVVPDARAFHVGAGSSSSTPLQERSEMLARARILVWEKHYPVRLRLMRAMVGAVAARVPDGATKRHLQLHLGAVEGVGPSSLPAESLAEPPLAVSVVIPSHSCPDALVRSIRSYLGARGVSEVIVVLHWERQTPPALQSMAADSAGRLRVIPAGQQCEASACRIVGAQAATCEWVLFGDEDVELEPDYVSRLSAIAVRHPNSIVAGRKLEGRWADSRQEMLRRGDWQLGLPMNSDWTDAVFSRKCPGLHRLPYLHSIALMSRRAIEAIGFDAATYRGNHYREETDFYVRARQAGYELLWANEAICYHLRDFSHEGGQRMRPYRRLFWVLTNNLRFMMKNRAVLQLDDDVNSVGLLAFRFSCRTVCRFVRGRVGVRLAARLRQSPSLNART